MYGCTYTLHILNWLPELVWLIFKHVKFKPGIGQSLPVGFFNPGVVGTLIIQNQKKQLEYIAESNPKIPSDYSRYMAMAVP